jgi:hypothetical protein
MRLRRRLAALALAALAFGATGTASASSGTSPTSATKSCPRSFVHAYLSWGEKCLHAGEFCKVGNREYLRCGFRCPATGHLVSIRRKP